uniref:CSON001078 protein n=1 Tax=Culicoides sonorensis TaxID=179676 RepID=A0A336MFV8_CULSO
MNNCSCNDFSNDIKTNQTYPLNNPVLIRKITGLKNIANSDIKIAYDDYIDKLNLVLMITSTLVLASIIYVLFEKYVFKVKSKIAPIISAFNPYNNLLSLYSDPPKNDSSTILCINGMRSFSCIMLVWMHYLVDVFCYFIKTFANPDQVTEIFNSYGVRLLFESRFFTDVFFTLSGFCLTYHFMHTQDKNGNKINLLVYYGRRYLRVVPPFVAAIFLNNYATSVLSGPIFYEDNIRKSNFCYNKWLKAVTFLDFAMPFEQCVFIGWFISFEMRFYLLSPLILFGIRKWRGKFVALISSIILHAIYRNYSANLVTVAKVKVNAPDALLINVFDFEERMAVWLIGIIGGYYMYRYSKNPIRIPKFFSFINWLICSVLGVWFFTGYYVSDEFMGSRIFLATQRFLWAIECCWIAFACHNSYANWLSWFFTLNIWNFIAKLSFCINLVHEPIIVIYAKQFNFPYEYNKLQEVIRSCGIILLSIFAAIPWTIFFEMPFVNLGKMVQKHFG